jgi:hypothetical protein
VTSLVSYVLKSCCHFCSAVERVKCATWGRGCIIRYCLDLGVELSRQVILPITSICDHQPVQMAEPVAGNEPVFGKCGDVEHRIVDLQLRLAAPSAL